MIRAWSGYLTFILVFVQIGSDWLSCNDMTECTCKWASGKKTASCVSAGLKQLPNLASDIQVLNLHGNPLMTLEEDAFTNIGLFNLQRLNLSSTSLQSLHANAFQDLRILIELDLSQNQLLQLSPNTFKGAVRLRVLILNGNPLSVLVAEQFPPLKRNEEVMCGGPEKLEEMSWRFLKRDDFVCPPYATSSPTVIRTETGAEISFGCFVRGGSLLAMTTAGFITTCICWKTKRRRVPPSRSFTDQEKKLLDTSLAVSCDRTSGDLGSSYGFEMLDRSISMESDDARCLEPVQITIEGPPGSFPPPPAEFALSAPYGNIFISVQVSGHNDEYPDLLGGGATLPRRSRTCFLKSAYDNMGPRITAAGSSTWSLPGANGDKNIDKDPISGPLSTFSTEFTAL
ncbi:hypothetical protein SFRURICE_013332 [Spodoptera frugiperda]|nr:hypothetical protein SFRURICE_013332 [Spodoptera frugiperda]